MRGVEEVEFWTGAWVWAVEVRCRSHDDDACEIDGLVYGEADHGFERSVVFLCCHAVDAGTVGEESGSVLESFAEKGAAIVDV